MRVEICIELPWGEFEKGEKNWLVYFLAKQSRTARLAEFSPDNRGPSLSPSWFSRALQVARFPAWPGSGCFNNEDTVAYARHHRRRKSLGGQRAIHGRLARTNGRSFPSPTALLKPRVTGGRNPTRRKKREFLTKFKICTSAKMYIYIIISFLHNTKICPKYKKQIKTVYGS